MTSCALSTAHSACRPLLVVRCLPQDMHGFNALHCAARNNKEAVLPALLDAAAAAAAAAGPDSEAAAAANNPVVAKNKDGFTPLALAAYHGAAAAAELLLKAHPPAAGQQDRHGFNPATLAARRGFADLAAQLQAAAEAAGVSGVAAAPAAAAAAAGRRPTLIVAPPQCEKHLTCPDPLPRGVCPPPENVERLRVLVEPGRGILRSDRLAQLLAWELNVPPAPMSDILRVHDWNYVRKLQVGFVWHSVFLPFLPVGFVLICVLIGTTAWSWQCHHGIKTHPDASQLLACWCAAALSCRRCAIPSRIGQTTKGTLTQTLLSASTPLRSRCGQLPRCAWLWTESWPGRRRMRSVLCGRLVTMRGPVGWCQARRTLQVGRVAGWLSNDVRGVAAAGSRVCVE